MAKIALLIGVSDYQPGFSPLPGTQTDIREMQRVLQHPEIGGFDQVELLSNPDTGEMQLAIEKLLDDRQRDDLVLLYFSGHGFKDDDGSLYFVTRTTEQRSTHQIYQSTAVPARVVQDWMSRSRCKRQVLVLDCCFSGAFAKGMKAKAVNETVDINAQFGGEGRAVLTSSTALQYSFEQQEASIYTRYLVEGIESGAADTDSNGVITIDELHDYAKRKVQEAAPAMKPEIYAVKEGYKIVLAKAPLRNPQLEYRKEVERLVQQRNGKLSNIMLWALDEKRRTLKLSPEEAETIQVEVLHPYQEFEEKLRRYEQVLAEEAREDFPLSEATRADLQYFQQVLGLRDEDIAEIEDRVILEQTIQSVPAPVKAELLEEELIGGWDLSEINAVTRTSVSAEDFHKRGLNKHNAGDFQGAIADYEQAIALQPDYAAPYIKRGFARYTLGDMQAAIQDFSQATRLSPDHAPAYVMQGLIRYALGDMQAAMQNYNQAIRLEPEDAATYRNRGVVHSALGDQRAAMQDYDKAIQLDPLYAPIYGVRGGAHFALGNKQAAIQDYKRAANLYQQQGETKDYQSMLNLIRQLRPWWKNIFE